MSLDTPQAPSPELEHEAIAMVKDRLSHRFPDVAPERLDATVDGEYHKFDHSSVRTYVPVLVEHAAGAMLASGEARPHGRGVEPA